MGELVGAIVVTFGVEGDPVGVAVTGLDLDEGDIV